MTRLRWFRFGLGIALGLIFGLYYAWDISPRRINRSSPRDMSPAFQDEYRVLVAAAYASDGNLLQASARLEILADSQPAQVLTALAQERLAAGYPQQVVRALAQLARDLEGGPVPTATSVPEVTTTSQASPTSAPTARVTAIPTPTPQPSFLIDRVEKICDPNLASPLIEVLVIDSQGNQLPGVEIHVLWDQGEDRFVTGMKPELGIGYADFEMQLDRTYSVRIANSRDPVTELRSEPCTPTTGEPYPGSWRLTFRVPQSP